MDLKITFLLVLFTGTIFSQWNGTTNKTVRESDLFGPLFDQAIDSADVSGVSLPDSVVYDSQISDMVTKSTSQTITGQKNFMGTVKVGSDTSVYLDQEGIGKNTYDTHWRAGHPGITMKVTNQSYTVADTAFNGRKDVQFGWGYNLGDSPLYNANDHTFGFNIESNWITGDGVNQTEFYSAWINPRTSAAYRPFGLTVNIVNDVSTFDLDVDGFVLRNKDDLTRTIWEFNYGDRALYFRDTSHIFYAVNGEWIKSANGTSVFGFRDYGATESTFIGDATHSKNFNFETWDDISADTFYINVGNFGIFNKLRVLSGTWQFQNYGDATWYDFLTNVETLDSSEVNGLIEIAKAEVLDSMNTLFENETRAKEEFHPLLNMAVDDTVRFNYYDEATIIDSIRYWFLPNDTAAVQWTFGTNGSGDTLLTAVDTLTGTGVLSTFAENIIPANSLFQMYFTYLDDATDYWFKVYRRTGEQATFDPLTYDANVVALFDGDLELTTSEWGDQSGNTYDLPFFNFPTVVSGGLNGHNTVEFNGTNEYGLRLNTPTLTQPYTIYIVLKVITANAFEERLFATDGDWGSLIQGASGSRFGLFSGNEFTATDTLGVGSYGIITCVFNSTSSELRLNLGTTKTGDAGSTSDAGISLASNGGGNPTNIGVAYLIIRDGADSDHTQTLYIRYLRERFGL